MSGKFLVSVALLFLLLGFEFAHPPSKNELKNEPGPRLGSCLGPGCLVVWGFTHRLGRRSGLSGLR